MTRISVLGIGEHSTAELERSRSLVLASGVDAILCASFCDERPPQGLLGALDWQLCGWISSLLAERRFEAGFGECALVSLPTDFRVRRLIWLGLGEKGNFGHERLFQSCSQGIAALQRAQVHHAGVILPGRSSATHSASEAASAWLRAVSHSQWTGSTTLYESHAELSNLSRALLRSRADRNEKQL